MLREFDENINNPVGGIINSISSLTSAFQAQRTFFYDVFMDKLFRGLIEVMEINNTQLSSYLQLKWQHIDNPGLTIRDNAMRSYTSIQHVKHLDATELLIIVTFRAKLYNISNQDVNFKIVLNIDQSDEEVGPTFSRRITDGGSDDGIYEIALQFKTTTLKTTKRVINRITLLITNKFAMDLRLFAINWLFQEIF